MSTEGTPAAAGNEDLQAQQPNDAETMAGGQSAAGENPMKDGAVGSDAADENDRVSREIFATVTSELETARAEAADYWNRLLRMQAEMENMRKRHQRSMENERKYSLEKFAGELLTVVDSLEMGLDAARKEDAEITHIIEGTELTLKALTQVLQKFAVEEVAPLGEKFNPELHQAMNMQPMEGVDPNTVVAVMQKGYKLHDRLIRPALVTVSK